MNKKLRNISLLLTLVTVILGQALVQAFSSPSLTPLIVMMGESAEEKATVSTVQKYYSDVKVVKFDSFDFALEISRSVGNVLYVGHGSEKGISSGNQVFSYDRLSQMSLAQPHFLACGSPTFNSIGKIDAVEAGIFGAAIIAFSRNDNSVAPTLLNDIVARDQSIRSGETQPMYLWLTGQEVPVRVINALLLTLSIFFTVSGAFLALKAKVAWNLFVLAGKGTLVVYRFKKVLDDLYFGASVDVIASDLVWLIAQLIDFVWFIFNNCMNWLEKIVQGAAIAADTASAPARVVIIALALLVAGALLILEAGKWIIDWNDPDSNPTP